MTRRSETGNGLAKFEPLGEHAQGERLHADHGVRQRHASGERARYLRHVSEPPAIGFQLDFDAYVHGDHLKGGGRCADDRADLDR